MLFEAGEDGASEANSTHVGKAPASTVVTSPALIDPARGLSVTRFQWLRL
jgi:hypothetical protein